MPPSIAGFFGSASPALIVSPSRPPSAKLYIRKLEFLVVRGMDLDRPGEDGLPRPFPLSHKRFTQRGPYAGCAALFLALHHPDESTPAPSVYDSWNAEWQQRRKGIYQELSAAAADEGLRVRLLSSLKQKWHSEQVAHLDRLNAVLVAANENLTVGDTETPPTFEHSVLKFATTCMSASDMPDSLHQLYLCVQQARVWLQPKVHTTV